MVGNHRHNGVFGRWIVVYKMLSQSVGFGSRFFTVLSPFFPPIYPPHFQPTICDKSPSCQWQNFTIFFAPFNENKKIPPKQAFSALQTAKMACNYSSHKANRCRNKAGECSPYGRNALNINKKSPFKGLLFHLHPKVNAKRWSGKRQKVWCRVVWNGSIFYDWICSRHVPTF